MTYGKAALAALLSCVLLGVPALAQNGAVKIGVLDDMSGPYAENTGPGDVAAAKFAIADFGGSVLGKPIELVSADFQSKVDVGVGIAKRWYDDENVDMVIGIPNSAIALALVKVAEEKNRIVMPTAAATSALTGKACGPQQHPLDLRHLRPDQDHRQCARQDRAATAGSSSPSTTPSGWRSKRTPPTSSRRRAARCWARCAIR